MVCGATSNHAGIGFSPDSARATTNQVKSQSQHG